MIFVDDGSQDQTVARLLEVSAGDSHVRVVQLRRNFGQTAAMAAGLDQASLSMVVTLDGDLQNDPRELPRMIEKLNEGFDLVAGWRRDRKDAFVSRKLPSMLANWLISRSTRVRLHDYGCTLKLMTHEVAKGIKLYGEMHRFIPALADEMGARIAELPVNHRPRKFGTSKYGISRTFRVILDLITVKFLLSYSKRPIHLFGSIGLGSASLGVLLLMGMIFQRSFMGIPMGNRPLLTLAVMMVIVGLQFLVFGLLGEVLARTYYESQGKKVYTVRTIFNPSQRVKQPSAPTTSAAGGESESWLRKAAS
jgi:glycosyltransferase involved in cell wall biosynthesis